jgi:hypothetical protein
MRRVTAKSLESTEAFISSYPRKVTENIEYRKQLHTFIAKDDGLKRAFLQLCLAEPQIYFDTVAWTYNPRKSGAKNIPFILRPKQIVAVRELDKAFKEGYPLIFDKSRDEGATEILMVYYGSRWHLLSDINILVGSRKEDLVDTSCDIDHGIVTGDKRCLFYKLMYGLNTLPLWWPTQYRKNDMRLVNLLNGSTWVGESTNDSFSAGGRYSSVIIDEFARVEPKVAQAIIENVPDTTDNFVINSTQWLWGAGHPYSRLLSQYKVVTLGWEDNPEKMVGAYHSPREGVIVIDDIDYYHGLVPTVFKLNMKGQELLIQNIETPAAKYGITFVADGGRKNYNFPRSVWFDIREKKAPTFRDLAQNVLRLATASADTFFDIEALTSMRMKYVRAPSVTGDIVWDADGYTLTNARFVDRVRRGKMSLWGVLELGKLPQDRNYVVSADISRGTGSSNSVLTILDTNTNEEVGLYVDPNIDIPDFAALAVATCMWVGGTKKPLLIWEANGPGETFGKQIVKYKTVRYYCRRNERSKHPESDVEKMGWYSTKGENGTKMDLLMGLDTALQVSLKNPSHRQAVIIRDEQTLVEMENYIYASGHVDVGPTAQMTETSGARYAHADRVISLGMAILARLGQRAGKVSEERRTPERHSPEERFRLHKEQERKNKLRPRKFMFGGPIGVDHGNPG